jgi:urea transport system substrate-binding protein
MDQLVKARYVLNGLAPVAYIANKVNLVAVLISLYTIILYYYLDKTTNKSYNASFSLFIVCFTIPIIFLKEVKLNDYLTIFKGSTHIYYLLLSISLFVSIYAFRQYVNPRFNIQKKPKDMIIFFMLLFIINYLIIRFTRFGEIKIGILIDKTGPNKYNDIEVLKFLSSLIEDTNKDGGINGKKIRLISYDTKSDINEYKKGINYMVNKNIKYVFCGGSSEIRKSNKKIVEKHNMLLFYYRDYEGQECSKNIIYSGVIPNQLGNNTVSWSMSNLGKEYFLLGSNNIYSKTYNKILRSLITSKSGKIIGEEYLSDNTTNKEEVQNAINKIMKNKNCVILSTCSRLSIPIYFELLHNTCYEKMENKDMLISDIYPTICFDISELDLKKCNEKHVIGHYVVSGYFEKFTSPGNMFLVFKFNGYTNSNFIITNEMHSILLTFKVLCRTISLTNNFDNPLLLRDEMYEKPIDTPYEMSLAILTKSNHFARSVSLGVIDEYKEITMIQNTIGYVEPKPWNDHIPETKGYLCSNKTNSFGEKYIEGPLKYEESPLSTIL